MAIDINLQADMLSQKIKHYLITTMGVTIDEANYQQFYHALALTLREEVMINWTATAHTFRQNHVRWVFYLCMECMPGKFFLNNLVNMNAVPLVKLILQKLNRNFDQILRDEYEPGLGNGGLGRLIACFLDSLATQRYPARGYGLRYQYGIFEQENWDGTQVERPDPWLLHDNPWEFRRDEVAVNINYAGRVIPRVNRRGVEASDLADYEEVRALAYDIPIIGYSELPDFNVATLRLWTTKESPRNFQLQRYNAGQLGQAAENTSLTDVLYPNDNNETGKRVRLKQEFLLVSASVQDIFNYYLRIYSDLSLFGDKVRIQMNDTHPALAVAELMRILLHDHDSGWGEAWETVRTCCSYTNHTVLREALEEWNSNRINYLLPRQYQIIEKLNMEFCTAIRRHFPGDEDRVQRMSMIEQGQVRMAHLAIYGSHKVNGVAALHSEILKTTLFRDFAEMYPDRFINVTNGVTQRRWLLTANPQLAELISQAIGRDWITNFLRIKEFAACGADSYIQKKFLAIKQERKHILIEFLREKNPLRDVHGKVLGHTGSLDETALFDVQIKRIHEYKRQLLNALHILMVYNELKANPNARTVKRMCVFAGKAAPGYEMAKNIIHLIYCLARKIGNDSTVNQKLMVAFVENYNVSKAEIIIPAADLSEQISTAGMEASGTGNMKLSINGALTIGTEDGANVEMRQAITDTWWPFRFGATAQQNAEMRQKRSYNALDIYNNNQAIKRAVDSLRDYSLAETDAEHQVLSAVAGTLINPSGGDPPDRYFVLNDLQNYYDMQKKVEELFLQPAKWAEYAIHNIAGMGTFSSDESIHNYSRLVWGLKPCPPDPQELARVRADYSEHDKCRIL